MFPVFEFLGIPLPTVLNTANIALSSGFRSCQLFQVKAKDESAENPFNGRKGNKGNNEAVIYIVTKNWTNQNETMKAARVASSLGILEDLKVLKCRLLAVLIYMILFSPYSKEARQLLYGC